MIDWDKIRKHREEQQLWKEKPLYWFSKNYNYAIAAMISGFVSGTIGIGGIFFIYFL